VESEGSNSGGANALAKWAQYGVSTLGYSRPKIRVHWEVPKMKMEKYFYRNNPDTTIDAICPFCFMTAATATNEEDLHYLESLHRCPTEAFVADQHLRLAS
jgi:hypothetical protein